MLFEVNASIFHYLSIVYRIFRQISGQKVFTWIARPRAVKKTGFENILAHGTSTCKFSKLPPVTRKGTVRLGLSIAHFWRCLLMLWTTKRNESNSILPLQTATLRLSASRFKTYFAIVWSRTSNSAFFAILMKCLGWSMRKESIYNCTHSKIFRFFLILFRNSFKLLTVLQSTKIKRNVFTERMICCCFLFEMFLTLVSTVPGFGIN